MRPKLLTLLLPIAVACTNNDDAHDDDTASVAAAQGTLSYADLAGTWHGVSMGEQSDTVLLRWTSVHATDTSGYFTAVGLPDTIRFRAHFDGDSIMTYSRPYAAGPTEHVFRSVGRLRDGKLVGTVVNALASKPDSIVSRGRWEASRTPR